ncbi:MAG: chromosome segregation ATPase [Planctomycetaceae bacterium]|jgi:chromosome segregation ATPase
MVSLKTAIVGGVSALALGTLILGTSWVSYVRTAKNEVTTAVEDAIPMEFQLKRAKDMLENELEPEIRKMKHAVAESQVEVEHLQAKLEDKQETVTQRRAEIMARNEQLKSQKTTFLVNDVSYTKAELEEDLGKRFDRFKTLEQTFKSEAKVIQAKQHAVEANESKVEKLLAAREELRLQIEELEARVSALEATETITESQFDDSKLSDVKELLDKLDAKVDVRERELSLEGKETDLIPVETEESTRNVVESVDAYFGNEAPFEDTASN